MPLTRLQVARDVWNSVRDNPTQFRFKGSVFTGRLTEIDESRTLEIGGQQHTPEFSLVVPLLDDIGNPIFTDPITLEDFLTIDNRDWLITRTTHDPFRASVTLDLATPHR